MRTVEDANIMLISRGHGRGHAVPDLAIAQAVNRQRPDLHLRFVSYSAGAEVFRAHGLEVEDLGKTDKSPLMDMTTCYGKLLAKERPLLIVAHEEFGVLPAAHIFDVPCLFITDFFIDPLNPLMWVLRYADEVLFTAERGVFTEPPYLSEKIQYVGRAVRPFHYGLKDRDRARKELGFSADELVVLCQPGAWNESQLPLADLLAQAWCNLPQTSKRLIWIAGRDHDSLMAKFGSDSTIIVLKEDWNMDRMMAASDLLITKANRITVYEAAAMGLPSISISDLVNWPDDVAVANVESNKSVSRDSITPATLAHLILSVASSQFLPAVNSSRGIELATNRILFHIETLCHR